MKNTGEQPIAHIAQQKFRNRERTAHPQLNSRRERMAYLKSTGGK